MNVAMVSEILVQSMYAGFLLLSPILGAGMAVGLAIAILQAATQIQESSIAFVPKLVAMSLAVVLAAPWLIGIIVNLTTGFIEEMAHIAPGAIG